LGSDKPTFCGGAVGFASAGRAGHVEPERATVA